MPTHGTNKKPAHEKKHVYNTINALAVNVSLTETLRPLQNGHDVEQLMYLHWNKSCLSVVSIDSLDDFIITTAPTLVDLIGCTAMDFHELTIGECLPECPHFWDETIENQQLIFWCSHWRSHDHTNKSVGKSADCIDLAWPKKTANGANGCRDVM